MLIHSLIPRNRKKAYAFSILVGAFVTVVILNLWKALLGMFVVYMSTLPLCYFYFISVVKAEGDQSSDESDEDLKED